MKVTVFTPTYNRAYIIESLYRSLRRQTNKNFEWLVIDDGSTDGTGELFEKWTKESNIFPIRYYYQNNGGKCRAINRGLDLADCELFFTVDSDDYLTDDAIEKILLWFENVDDDKIKGIVANRGYTATETENYCFPENYLDKSLLDIYSFYRNGKQVFDGERAFVFYTEFHRKYRYPEFEKENFMTEAVAWNRMAADGYLMRYYNDIIWVFRYRDDGLTKAGTSVFIKNPYGYGLWLTEKAKYQKKSWIERQRLFYTYTCDMSPFWNCDVIAGSIGMSKNKIHMFQFLHTLLGRLKRKGSSDGGEK